MYNLTVANEHSYYVGIGGVLGHNAGCYLPGNKLWKHIFEGDYDNRKLSGVHHAMFGKSPNGIRIVPFSSRKNYKKGFYKALVYKITQSGSLRPRNGKYSTMFPDNWSQKRVKQTIRKAYILYLKNGNNPVPLSSIMGRDYRGISIRFHFDNKNITSAYPEFN